MKEISPERLYHGLLAHGLFTEKLPPIFTSVNFFDYCQSKKHNFHSKKSTYIYFESMREINIPRQLGIPNPIAYQQLCRCLSKNWYKICNHFVKYASYQTYKVSGIHIRKLAETSALFKMNYNEKWKKDGSPEPDLIMGKRYLVKADIATFFPSIYTHSLPWALVGKKAAKINHNKKCWYNDIDHYVQNLKHGETHGLLIGPHASNLLSEIILTVIDYNLNRKGWNNYIRNVDDYTCYVDTYESGQKFIIDLSEELNFFDLNLNYKKSSIEELPLAASEQWIRQINTILTKSEGETMNYREVMAYLDNVIEIMHYNNDMASILNYAIKVLSGKKMTSNAKEYCIKTIFHYSILFPYLVPLIDKYVISTYNVDLSLINKFTNQIFQEGIRFRNNEEVSFSLFFAIKYNFPIPSINIDELLKTNNCIILLLSFLYYKKVNNKDAWKVIKNHVLKLSSNDDDFSQNWVFIYEVLSKNNLKDEWKDIKNMQVTFLRPIK